ncbi:hypothetical protein HTSR_1490 [Halodesulfurarchaeum formicicum]|uniref:DUF3194 domain-containing protein n=1 Tax=Halodesulfurarchaeum formicicum TaxID=1873524 RepID=A0A1D8S5M9_9EURY|nr:DUF3194 domain-containing protein [Halodesulfurarchaeum formicicum]AOW80666.1 hypothetical protein HTSR_1490 [Halodesulfurarchaeum formicicum]APE96004.1 hypothetical protein HSR6_1561 [Halodesulfurarchaeum formicicum]
MVDSDTVVETASEAAHGYVFSRLKKSDVEDIDVTVSFEDQVLEVDVSILAPEVEADLERIADDAARAAGNAVDDLFEQ